MYYLIYETTNLVNGKRYIGMHQTEDLNSSYLGSGLALAAAIEKYGRESFSKKILHSLNSREEMIAMEKKLVTQEIVESDDYYNLRIGGHGGKLTDDIKKKIGAKSKAWWSQKSPAERTEHIRHMQRNYTTERRSEVSSGVNNGMYGKQHTEETKKKLQENSAKADHTITKWKHTDGCVFVGPMRDFYKTYNLCRAWCMRVRRGEKKTIKGWQYVGEV